MAHPITNLFLEDSALSLPINKGQHPYSVGEYEEVAVPLSELIVNGELRVYDQVREGDFFTINRKKGRLVFQAGGYIGRIPINEHVVLDVSPRVPLRNLERMISIANYMPIELRKYQRYYAPHEQPVPSMIDIFAQALIRSIREIELHGIHREYVQRTRDTSFPHGRVLLSETMQRHQARGVGHRVAASWFEQTVDIAPNRCLKYAIWYLAVHYNATGQNRTGLFQGLEKAFDLFRGAYLDKSLHFLSASTVVDPETLPSIRAYYRPALYLALTILRNQGVSFADDNGRIKVPSFLIDLKTTFESYLRTVLRTRLRHLEQYVRVLDGNIKGSDGGAKMLFDEPPSPSATADIVFRNAPSPTRTVEYPLIVEVKYKKYKKPERTEIEQAITYGVSYRTPIAVIIHPLISGATHGLRVLGRIGALTLYHYAFDLAANDPEEEEEKFALSMWDLLRSVPTT